MMPLFKSPPSPPSVEEARERFARDLMELREKMNPLLEAATGMKADLESRSWSPTAAEAAALVWLQGMLAMCATAGARR